MRCTCGRQDAWRVSQRHCNHSAFSGRRRTPSDYSEVVCVRELGGCGSRWRTKAAYVERLPDFEPLPPAAPVCVDCGRGDLPDNPLVIPAPGSKQLSTYHRERCL